MNKQQKSKSQARKFINKARELSVVESEDALDKTLRRLTKPKPKGKGPFARACFLGITLLVVVGCAASTKSPSLAEILPPDELETEGSYLVAALQIHAMPTVEASMLRDALAVCSNVEYAARGAGSLNQCHSEIDRFLLEYDSNREVDQLLVRLKFLDGLIRLEYVTVAAAIGHNPPIQDTITMLVRRNKIKNWLEEGYKARR